jgi:preprotein translocase subunit SecY
MFRSIANRFKIPELKSWMLFTVAILAVCRLVAFVRVPGLDGVALTGFFEEQAKSGSGGGMLGMYSLFTGGALVHCAVGALNIMPYITAVIVIQLLFSLRRHYRVKKGPREPSHNPPR